MWFRGSHLFTCGFLRSLIRDYSPEKRRKVMRWWKIGKYSATRGTLFAYTALGMLVRSAVIRGFIAGNGVRCQPASRPFSELPNEQTKVTVRFSL
jgi:hypothetical protein